MMMMNCLERHRQLPSVVMVFADGDFFCERRRPLPSVVMMFVDDELS